MSTHWTAPHDLPTADDVADLPEILTADQAAWMMRLSRGQLDAARKRGEIPAAKIGRSYRYSKAQLLAVVVGG